MGVHAVGVENGEGGLGFEAGDAQSVTDRTYSNRGGGGERRGRGVREG